MAVYVDDARHKWRGMLWCHMTADTLDELHAMAGKLGLKREWYQGPPKTRYAHYDTIASRRLKAVRLGAIPVTSREIVVKAKALAVDQMQRERFEVQSLKTFDPGSRG